MAHGGHRSEGELSSDCEEDFNRLEEDIYGRGTLPPGDIPRSDVSHTDRSAGRAGAPSVTSQVQFKRKGHGRKSRSRNSFDSGPDPWHDPRPQFKNTGSASFEDPVNCGPYGEREEWTDPRPQFRRRKASPDLETGGIRDPSMNARFYSKEATGQDFKPDMNLGGGRLLRPSLSPNDRPPTWQNHRSENRDFRRGDAKTRGVQCSAYKPCHSVTPAPPSRYASSGPLRPVNRYEQEQPCHVDRFSFDRRRRQKPPPRGTASLRIRAENSRRRVIDSRRLEENASIKYDVTPPCLDKLESFGCAEVKRKKKARKKRKHKYRPKKVESAVGLGNTLCVPAKPSSRVNTPERNRAGRDDDDVTTATIAKQKISGEASAVAGSGLRDGGVWPKSVPVGGTISGGTVAPGGPTHTGSKAHTDGPTHTEGTSHIDGPTSTEGKADTGGPKHTGAAVHTGGAAHTGGTTLTGGTDYTGGIAHSGGTAAGGTLPPAGTATSGAVSSGSAVPAASTGRKFKKKFFNISDFKEGTMDLEYFLLKFRELEDRERTLVIWPLSRLQRDSPAMQKVIHSSDAFTSYFDDPYSSSKCDTGLVAVKYTHSASYGLWCVGVRELMRRLSPHINVNQLDKQQSVNSFLKFMWQEKRRQDDRSTRQSMVFLRDVHEAVTEGLLMHAVARYGGCAAYVIRDPASTQRHAMVLFNGPGSARAFCRKSKARGRKLLGRSHDAFYFGEGGESQGGGEWYPQSQLKAAPTGETELGPGVKEVQSECKATTPGGLHPGRGAAGGHAGEDNVPPGKMSPKCGDKRVFVESGIYRGDTDMQCTDTGLHSSGTGMYYTNTLVHSRDTGIHSTDTGLQNREESLLRKDTGILNNDSRIISTDSAVHKSGTGTHSTCTGIRNSGTGGNKAEYWSTKTAVAKVLKDSAVTRPSKRKSCLSDKTRSPRNRKQAASVTKWRAKLLGRLKNVRSRPTASSGILKGSRSNSWSNSCSENGRSARENVAQHTTDLKTDSVLGDIDSGVCAEIKVLSEIGNLNSGHTAVQSESEVFDRTAVRGESEASVSDQHKDLPLVSDNIGPVYSDISRDSSVEREIPEGKILEREILKGEIPETKSVGSSRSVVSISTLEYKSKHAISSDREVSRISDKLASNQDILLSEKYKQTEAVEELCIEYSTLKQEKENGAVCYGVDKSVSRIANCVMPDGMNTAFRCRRDGGVIQGCNCGCDDVIQRGLTQCHQDECIDRGVVCATRDNRDTCQNSDSLRENIVVDTCAAQQVGSGMNTDRCGGLNDGCVTESDREKQTHTEITQDKIDLHTNHINRMLTNEKDKRAENLSRNAGEMNKDKPILERGVSGCFVDNDKNCSHDNDAVDRDGAAGDWIKENNRGIGESNCCQRNGDAAQQRNGDTAPQGDGDAAMQGDGGHISVQKRTLRCDLLSNKDRCCVEKDKMAGDEGDTGEVPMSVPIPGSVSMRLQVPVLVSVPETKVHVDNRPMDSRISVQDKVFVDPDSDTLPGQQDDRDNATQSRDTAVTLSDMCTSGPDKNSVLTSTQIDRDTICSQTQPDDCIDSIPFNPAPLNPVDTPVDTDVCQVTDVGRLQSHGRTVDCECQTEPPDLGPGGTGLCFTNETGRGFHCENGRGLSNETGRGFIEAGRGLDSETEHGFNHETGRGLSNGTGRDFNDETGCGSDSENGRGFHSEAGRTFIVEVGRLLDSETGRGLSSETGFGFDSEIRRGSADNSDRLVQGCTDLDKEARDAAVDVTQNAENEQEHSSFETESACGEIVPDPNDCTSLSAINVVSDVEGPPVTRHSADEDNVENTSSDCSFERDMNSEGCPNLSNRPKLDSNRGCGAAEVESRTAPRIATQKVITLQIDGQRHVTVPKDNQAIINIVPIPEEGTCVDAVSCACKVISENSPLADSAHGISPQAGTNRYKSPVEPSVMQDSGTRQPKVEDASDKEQTLPFGATKADPIEIVSSDEEGENEVSDLNESIDQTENCMSHDLKQETLMTSDECGTSANPPHSSGSDVTSIAPVLPSVKEENKAGISQVIQADDSKVDSPRVRNETPTGSCIGKKLSCKGEDEKGLKVENFDLLLKTTLPDCTAQSQQNGESRPQSEAGDVTSTQQSVDNAKSNAVRELTYEKPDNCGAIGMEQSKSQSASGKRSCADEASRQNGDENQSHNSASQDSGRNDDSCGALEPVSSAKTRRRRTSSGRRTSRDVFENESSAGESSDGSSRSCDLVASVRNAVAKFYQEKGILPHGKLKSSVTHRNKNSKLSSKSLTVSDEKNERTKREQSFGSKDKERHSVSQCACHNPLASPTKKLKLNVKGQGPLVEKAVWASKEQSDQQNDVAQDLTRNRRVSVEEKKKARNTTEKCPSEVPVVVNQRKNQNNPEAQRESRRSSQEGVSRSDGVRDSSAVSGGSFSEPDRKKRRLSGEAKTIKNVSKGNDVNAASSKTRTSLNGSVRRPELGGAGMMRKVSDAEKRVSREKISAGEMNRNQRKRSAESESKDNSAMPSSLSKKCGITITSGLRRATQTDTNQVTSLDSEVLKESKRDSGVKARGLNCQSLSEVSSNPDLREKEPRSCGSSLAVQGAHCRHQAQFDEVLYAADGTSTKRIVGKKSNYDPRHAAIIPEKKKIGVSRQTLSRTQNTITKEVTKNVTKEVTKEVTTEDSCHRSAASLAEAGTANSILKPIKINYETNPDFQPPTAKKDPSLFKGKIPRKSKAGSDVIAVGSRPTLCETNCTSCNNKGKCTTKHVAKQEARRKKPVIGSKSEPKLSHISSNEQNENEAAVRGSKDRGSENYEMNKCENPPSVQRATRQNLKPQRSRGHRVTFSEQVEEIPFVAVPVKSKMSCGIGESKLKGLNPRLCGQGVPRNHRDARIATASDGRIRAKTRNPKLSDGRIHPKARNAIASDGRIRAKARNPKLSDGRIHANARNATPTDGRIHANARNTDDRHHDTGKNGTPPDGPHLSHEATQQLKEAISGFVETMQKAAETYVTMQRKCESAIAEQQRISQLQAVHRYQSELAKEGLSHPLQLSPQSLLCAEELHKWQSQLFAQLSNTAGHGTSRVGELLCEPVMESAPTAEEPTNQRVESVVQGLPYPFTHGMQQNQTDAKVGLNSTSMDEDLRPRNGTEMRGLPINVASNMYGTTPQVDSYKEGDSMLTPPTRQKMSAPERPVPSLLDIKLTMEEGSFHQPERSKDSRRYLCSQDIEDGTHDISELVEGEEGIDDRCPHSDAKPSRDMDYRDHIGGPIDRDYRQTKCGKWNPHIDATTKRMTLLENANSGDSKETNESVATQIEILNQKVDELTRVVAEKPATSPKLRPKSSQVKESNRKIAEKFKRNYEQRRRKREEMFLQKMRLSNLRHVTSLKHHPKPIKDEPKSSVSPKPEFCDEKPISVSNPDENSNRKCVAKTNTRHVTGMSGEQSSLPDSNEKTMTCTADEDSYKKKSANDSIDVGTFNNVTSPDVTDGSGTAGTCDDGSQRRRAVSEAEEERDVIDADDGPLYVEKCLHAEDIESLGSQSDAEEMVKFESGIESPDPSDDEESECDASDEIYFTENFVCPPQQAQQDKRSAKPTDAACCENVTSPLLSDRAADNAGTTSVLVETGHPTDSTSNLETGNPLPGDGTANSLVDSGSLLPDNGGADSTGGMVKSGDKDSAERGGVSKELLADLAQRDYSTTFQEVHSILDSVFGS